MSSDGLYPATEATSALPEAGTGLVAAPAIWLVLHVRSRQERVVAGTIAALGARAVLPMFRHRRRVGRRQVESESPMFPGYVFLHGSLEQAYQADRTGRVASIIRVGDQARLQWELENIQLAQSRGGQLDPFPFLQQGVRVGVRSGPFIGLQGVVEERAANDRLILQVQSLGRAVSLEIDGALLDPLD